MQSLLIVLAVVFGGAAYAGGFDVGADARHVLEALDRDAPPAGTHVVFARVLNRGRDGDLPTATLRLFEAVERGDDVVFKPTKHTVEHVGWLPPSGLWRMTVAFEEGRTWAAFDKAMPVALFDPLLVPKRWPKEGMTKHLWGYAEDQDATARAVQGAILDDRRARRAVTLEALGWYTRNRRVNDERPPGKVEMRLLAEEQAAPALVPVRGWKWTLQMGDCAEFPMTGASLIAHVLWDGERWAKKVRDGAPVPEAAGHQLLDLFELGAPEGPASGSAVDRTLGLSLWRHESGAEAEAVLNVLVVLGNILGFASGATAPPPTVYTHLDDTGVAPVELERSCSATLSP